MKIIVDEMPNGVFNCLFSKGEFIGFSCGLDKRGNCDLCDGHCSKLQALEEYEKERKCQNVSKQ